MSAAKLDITIEQGATWKRVFLLRTKGIDIVLTGYTAHMQIRAIPLNFAVAPLADISTAGGGIVLETGRITLTIADEATTLFTCQKAVFDITLTSPNGEVMRLAQGNVTVSPQVTRP